MKKIQSINKNYPIYDFLCERTKLYQFIKPESIQKKKQNEIVTLHLTNVICNNKELWMLLNKQIEPKVIVIFQNQCKKTVILPGIPEVTNSLSYNSVFVHELEKPERKKLIL